MRPPPEPTVSIGVLGMSESSNYSRGPAQYVASIKVLDSEVEVVQVAGGGWREGGGYVYVYEDGYFVNIGHLREARLVSREVLKTLPLAGRPAVTREVYRITRESLSGRPLLLVNLFTDGEVHADLCEVGEQYVSCSEYPVRVDEGLAKDVVAKFKLLGAEAPYLQIYLKLVEEVGRTLPRLGCRDVECEVPVRRVCFNPPGHDLLPQIVRRPYLSAMYALALNTPEERVEVLRGMVTLLAELWTVAKIAEAVDGYSLEGSWRIGNNVPFAFIRSRRSGRVYTVLYQLDLYQVTFQTYVVSLGSVKYEVVTWKHHPLTEDGRKSAVVDILVLSGKLEGRVDLDRLRKLEESGENPLLLVEVKLGIPSIRNWRDVVLQMKDYLEVVKPRYAAFVALGKATSTLRRELKALSVEVFENVLDEREQERFKYFVAEALGER